MSYPPPPGSPYGAPPAPAVAPPYPAAPAPTQSRRPLLLAALAGFLVAAVLAGVLVAAGVFDGGDATSTASISLPDKVDTFVSFDQVKSNQANSLKRVVAYRLKADSKTAAELSAAHNGAGAAVQTYASEDLLTLFEIWAVRAPTTRPVLPYEDAAFLGLAQPQNVVRQYGRTWCALSSEPVAASQKPKANSYFATTCVRSDDHLSVIYSGGGENDFSSDPARVAKAVDEIWDAVS